MAAQKTEAIVIRTFPLKEFHKIITFYTPDFGKVKAVAYGVKSPKSKLGGSLELLNHGTLIFQYRENRELQSITDFNLIHGFDTIRSDFTRITYGCYFAELVDSIASEGIASPEIFDLLRTTYQFLVHVNDVRLLARGFEIKFLDAAGYGPELSQCVHCSSPMNGSFSDEKSKTTNRFGIGFSARYGGVLCTHCKNRDGAAFTISLGSCELLKMLRRSEWERFNRIHASTSNHKELKRVLGSFIEYYTERSLKSLRFIENVL